jgi:phosphogluconate dehydratase
MTVAPSIAAVTARIVERSKPGRETYLDRVRQAASNGPHRSTLSCGNLAHGFAACGPTDKAEPDSADVVPNLGIITAYNDMLSAHQPFETYPGADQARRRAKPAAWRRWPAACRRCATASPRARTGMELSLFSRDVIAMAAGIGLSHNMFDAAVYLGVCDKIVPGLLIAALTFGHLPSVFIPAGTDDHRPVPNDEKTKTRQLYAEGKVGRAELLEVGKSQILSRAGHLHLLRHRQLEPDADGDHGPAHARRFASSIRARRCETR